MFSVFSFLLSDFSVSLCRSYGRAPKMIHLESNFIPFKEELLPKEGNKALLTFPFLHIYWTDCCETEVYKATTKDDITKWQNVLRAHNTTDWLIVVVESEAKKKNKTNILPRTSIADKIRSDFCNKQSDRCMVLVDPLKDTSRSQESWSLFLAKLRTLLLTSFTRNLGHFEDEMRTLREKRTEPGWSFCDYFMVQEELAFVFEMLQQFEDALVQYDELDALFSQYVLNFGAGDEANWLSSFCQPVRSWDGLALRKPIDMEKRDLIQRRQANLLELRSYLFSRQCTLLLFLQRPWEVANRALELLHNCVQELKLLEVSVPPGALDCWVFLSCLEVLQRIEGCCERAQLEANVSHTVGLWSYATEKLQSLGSLCGLVSELGPCSEDLQRTVDLLAGLGAERAETANAAHSPYKKLQEALSSEDAFEKHYLELCHATMEMYNSIGRIRSAKLVGKDLADFYMKKNCPQKAELYLQGALNMYQSEGWELPLTHTRKQLAECQRRLGQTESYLRTCSLLAADVNLSQEERQRFCQEILKFAAKDSNVTGTPGLPPTGIICSALTSLSFDPPMLLFIWSPGGKEAPPALELSEMHEKSPSEGGLVTAGVICRNVHVLLRAQDVSSSTMCTPDPQLKVEPHSECLLAGIPQRVKFTVTTGHYNIKNGDTLQLSNADSMPILLGTGTTAAVYRNSQGEASEHSMSIQRSDKVTSICLPPTPPYHILEFELDVVCLLPEAGHLLNGEVPRKGREQRDSHGTNTTEQRVTVDCPWSIYSTIVSLSFQLPQRLSTLVDRRVGSNWAVCGRSSDSWIENDPVSVEDPCEVPSGRAQNKGSISPGYNVEHKGPPTPRLQPFHPGQISNSSIGRQILVVPSTDDHVLEVNVT
ncbi:hypothetical protein GDO86_019539 [Hymenochirus boettgeri]|uniref:Trafficking protein particle complex 10 n=1 Tax=Hymenochirus boettgeri TaxID=247094 RepID=A0A8T2IEJ7_9PIPI|nr:hypothetical protein GDO86_019539 [Hymenochirus boettgeri]